MESGKWKVESGKSKNKNPFSIFHFPLSTLHSPLSAFSLIEVVLALAILIVGLVAIVLLFPVGLRASREAGIISEATLLAQSRIEEIKTLGYDQVKDKEGTQGPFKWTTSVEDVAPEGITDAAKLKKVSVTVTWKQTAQERKETFVTMVSQ